MCAQVISNNTILSSINTQNTSVYRLRLGRLKFYNSTAALVASQDRGFGIADSLRPSTSLAIQSSGYPKISFNYRVFVPNDIQNNTVGGIQFGDVIELTTTTAPITTYRYFVRFEDGQLADDDRGRNERVRIFIAVRTQAVLDASNPLPNAITDGTEFDVSIRRWDAPRSTNRVQVWTRLNGLIHSSFFNKIRLGIDQILTSAERIKFDNIDPNAEVNVQADFTENDTTAETHIRNRPFSDGLNFYYALVSAEATFKATADNAWHVLAGSNTPFIDGGFNSDDARKVGATSAEKLYTTLADVTQAEPITSIREDNRPDYFFGVPNVVEDFYNIVSPQRMFYIQWGNFAELVPFSMMQYFSLDPLVAGDVVPASRYNGAKPNYLLLSHENAAIRIGRTAENDMLISIPTSAWIINQQYYEGNAVSYNSKIYVAKADVRGNTTPDNDAVNWDEDPDIPISVYYQ